MDLHRGRGARGPEPVWGTLLPVPAPSSSPGAAARAPRLGRLRHAGLAALVAAGVVVASVAADAALLVHRMPTIALSPSGTGAGTAYLLLASDSRERLTGADRERYADAAQAEGERADLVLLLRRTAEGRAELLSIPRDLYVGAGGDNPHRLGLALQGGSLEGGGVHAHGRTLLAA